MNKFDLGGVVIISMLALSACSSESIKSSTYEALYQKDCMDRTGSPNCDPQHESYDAYSKDREKALK